MPEAGSNTPKREPGQDVAVGEAVADANTGPMDVAQEQPRRTRQLLLKFPREDSDIVQREHNRFIHNAMAMLLRKVDPQVSLHVLQSVAQTTGDRVRFTLMHSDRMKAHTRLQKGKGAAAKLRVLLSPQMNDYEAALLSSQIEGFGGARGKSLEEHVRLHNRSGTFIDFAQMFIKYAEGSSKEVACMFLDFAFRNGRNIDVREMPEGKAGDLELKERFLAILEQRGPVDEKRCLQQLLGNNLANRLFERYKTPRKVMWFLWYALGRSHEFRTNILAGLHTLVHARDAALATSLVHQGTAALAHAKEVTDYEWWNHLKEVLEQKAVGMKITEEGGDDEPIQISGNPFLDLIDFSKDEPWREEAEEMFRHYLKAVGYTADVLPDLVRELTEAIDCPGWAARLRQLRERNDVHELAAAEQELAQRVFRHVLRYTHPSKGDGAKYRESYKRGFPSETIQGKAATCFSGPWLTASLLMEAGIREEQLSYANVFEDDQKGNSWSGTHGALIVRTSSNKLFFIDHGFRRAGSPLYLWMTKGLRQRDKAKDMLLGESRDVQLLEMENPNRAAALDLPSLFQIMPLKEGLVSGHLLHVGIDFMHRGMLKEAAHAFDIGLTANPEDPDLHCYRGRVAHLLKDEHGTVTHFDSALRAYPRHLMAIFSVGEYWRSKGKHEVARNSFIAVAFDTRPIWGDGWIREKAREYLGLPRERQPGEEEQFVLDFEQK